MKKTIKATQDAIAELFAQRELLLNWLLETKKLQNFDADEALCFAEIHKRKGKELKAIESEIKYLQEMDKEVKELEDMISTENSNITIIKDKIQAEIDNHKKNLFKDEESFAEVLEDFNRDLEKCDNTIKFLNDMLSIKIVFNNLYLTVFMED